MTEPPYVELARSGELARRAEEAFELLGPRCVVCPRGCKVDRRADVAGLCAVGRHAVVASYFPHFGEEDCLRGRRGSGTIFFSGCNLRCVFCLAPGTRVATSEGPRPIEALFLEGSDELAVDGGTVRRAAGMRVVTATGELAPVSKLFRHHHSGELVRVKAMSVPELRVTPNHEVYATHRSTPGDIAKIPAGNLTLDHMLVVPKRESVDGRMELETAAILTRHVSRPLHTRGRRAEDIEPLLRSSRTSRDVGAALGFHPAYVRTLRSRLARGLWPLPDRVRHLVHEEGRIRFSGEHRPGIPERVAVTTPVAWLLGLYCAEGHVQALADRPNSFRLVLSLGPHEATTVARATSVLRRSLGVRPVVVDRATTTTVEVGKTSVALLLRGLANTGARQKRVPGLLFSAEDSILRSFLDGYLTGDGTVTRTHLVGTTVSEDLAQGLYEIGLRLGVLPSIHHWNPPRTTVIEERRVRQAPIWYVKFKRDRLAGAPGTRERTRWKDAGDHFLVPIREIARERYEGDVYNLEVDHPTHSYVASGVAVGNCQNHDISWELRGERAPPERLAAMMLELQAIGCHNINFVTPEHVVPQVLEALPLAVEDGLRLPIVYNTSAYDSLDSLQLLDGVVDIYMPDFKLWTAESARRYLKRADYADAARETIPEMHRQVGELIVDRRGLARRGVILRHLVMPGLVEETEAILRWVAEELGTGVYVNLMAQYYVSGKVGQDGQYVEIARGIRRDEYEQALSLARELGLRLDPRSVSERYALSAGA
jgi:putative pyruvate formate lyase activating enzyme